MSKTGLPPAAGIPGWFGDKEPTCQFKETQVQSLVQEDPLEEEMAAHSSILAWRTSWTEVACGLRSIIRMVSYE